MIVEKQPSAKRYTGAAMVLHWLVAILVFTAAGLALFREAFGSVSLTMISLHKQVGLAILSLALARLAWRLSHRPPPHNPPIPRWEARLAETVHRLLYVLLIAVPVTGWLFVSLAPVGRQLDYRGEDSVPRLPLAIDDAASFGWHEAHELMGFALIGLFLAHLSGVARHQLVTRGGLLARMAGPGVPRLLAGVAILFLALWLIGLSLDFFGIRLLGDAPLGALEPLRPKD